MIKKNKRYIKNSEKKQSVITIIRKVLPDAFKISPKLVVLYILVSISYGTSFPMIVMLQQRFFDDTAKLMAKQISLNSALASLMAMGIGYIVNQVLSGAARFLPGIIYGKAGGYISSKIYTKISKLAPITFEDTEKLDCINKAEQGKNNALQFTFDFMDILLFYVPYFTVMSLYLYSLKPILTFSIILVFLPKVISQIIRSKLYSGLEDESAPIRREYDHYEECMVSRDYYKETRLLGGFKYFSTKYLEALSSLQRIRYKAASKVGFIELGMTLMSILGYIGILFLLFKSLMEGDITVGSFAAVFASMGWMFGIMEQVVNYRIPDMANDMGTVCNYLNFLELEEEEVMDVEFTKDIYINLDNVSFSYPGVGKAAVKNVNLAVKDGETLAIVGENGSGKSTLIRLITGLYSPSVGMVSYNGEDISKINRNSVFKGTSAVFQKHKKYEMTLEENISISDAEVKSERDYLNTICQFAGVEYMDKKLFPEEYETMLSVEFDGVDLSGGEWQRVAIARAFFRRHNLIVLDEPTASIDPYEETKIYNQFAKISKGKTSIIVTHRLGTIKLADRIVVMKEGEIIQEGTHDELIKQPGEYLRLYESQKKWYVSE